MTAAEILRNATPPADDGLIDQAIADLDKKIWEWTDALKGAHLQLRSAFAVRTPQRPSDLLYADTGRSLSAAAAAAHVSSPPPMPAEWTAPPSSVPAWNAPPPPPPTQEAARGVVAGPEASPLVKAWPAPPPAAAGDDAAAAAASGGVVAWPTAAPVSWPDANAPVETVGPQAWPTWTPADTTPKADEDGAAKKPGSGPNAKATKAQKAAKQALADGPTPEERAQKAAAEEALLSELDDSIARRVRLLRRLDPDTAIEKLIEKARQGHAEASTAAPARDDKSSSWWRRK